MDMDKVDFAILDMMINVCGADSKMRAATSKAICAGMDMKVDTLYRRLVGLMEKGVVSKGFKERREHTWYVTENGLKALREV